MFINILKIKKVTIEGFEPSFDTIAAPITDKGLENPLGYIAMYHNYGMWSASVFSLGRYILIS
tara:strand:+ start:223 stop:411 length:189 start_codon:yes stop_codon:yes gene_type:complete